MLWYQVLTARRQPNKNSSGFVGELMRKGLAITLFTLSLAGTAQPGPHDFVGELGHVGGDAQTAQPYIDQFMRYLETALKWPANTAHGQFTIKEAEAVQYIDRQKPAYGIFDPEVFLSLHKKY